MSKEIMTPVHYFRGKIRDNIIKNQKTYTMKIMASLVK